VDHNIRLNFRHSNYLQRGIVYDVAHSIFGSFQPIKNARIARNRPRPPKKKSPAKTGLEVSLHRRGGIQPAEPYLRYTEAGYSPPSRQPTEPYLKTNPQCAVVPVADSGGEIALAPKYAQAQVLAGLGPSPTRECAAPFSV
jgi:hypothetical protein